MVFVGGGGGEEWGNLAFFSNKKCWPSHEFILKTPDPPSPHSTFRQLTKVQPSPHCYIQCMFHAIKNPDYFTWECKMFEYEYISRSVKTIKCKQSAWNIYVL